MTGNRTKRTVGVASLPNVVQADGRFFDGCCETFMALAHPELTGRYYNDVNYLPFKLSSEDDTAVWKLIHDGVEINPLTDPSEPLGVLATFTGDQNVICFIIEWRSVLTQYGIGCYKAVCDYNVNGIEGRFEYREFDLQIWSEDRTEGTVRMLSIFDDYSRLLDIDFTNTGIVDSIRFNGEFGRMKPNAEIINHTSVGFERRKGENEFSKSYELSAERLTSCYSNRIIDEHLLHANEIWISDHNAYNHIQTYKDYPVILKKESSIDPEYFDGSRYATIKAEFEDKLAIHESGFSGVLSTNTHVILELLENAGGGSCADAEITLNGNTFITVVSGGSADIVLIDQNGDAITPEDITGSEITINVPSLPSLPPGTYIPDNSDSEILWQPMVADVDSGLGYIQKTDGGADWNRSNFALIPHNGDFQVNFRFDFSGGDVMFGLTYYHANAGIYNLDMTFHKSSGDTAGIWEGGVQVIGGIPTLDSDIFSLKRESNQLKYMINGITIRTINLSNVGFVNIDSSFFSSNKMVSDIEVVIP